MGKQKFGSYCVIVRTALSNIRITTIFVGESEVRIVDPSRNQEKCSPFGCEFNSFPR
jgi:hypothetical protein